MIRQTIIIFLLLFTGFNLYLHYAHPAAGKGQHQWQKNVIEAQEYIYEHQGTPNVMVGSSLTFRIDNNMLPKDYYNLSLGGGSIFTGLDIILRCDKKPKRVFIETNFIIRPGDEAMVTNLFRPVVADMKEKLPALKEKNQPVNLLLPILTRFIGGKGDKPAPVDSATFKKLLGNYIADHQKRPDTVLLNKNIDLLRSKIELLRKNGIEVIFYRMPVHCTLEATPYNQEMDKRIKAAFPETEYRWLPMPDCARYLYNDGEHLSYGSAVDFSRWLVRNSDKPFSR